MQTHDQLECFVSYFGEIFIDIILLQNQSGIRERMTTLVAQAVPSPEPSHSSYAFFLLSEGCWRESFHKSVFSAAKL